MSYITLIKKLKSYTTYYILQSVTYYISKVTFQHCIYLIRILSLL